jgi:putative addiction module component (TIGR02574 family)
MGLLGAPNNNMLFIGSISGEFMGAETLSKLRSEALMLPEAERAELAHALVKSLDAPAEENVTEAWDKEILRRLAEIDAGTAKLVDREEFRRRMQERLGRRR